MHPNDKITCDECRYWCPHERPENVMLAFEGECHRYAPRFPGVYSSGAEGVASPWPQTDSGDWCGEAQAE